jgi:hypothetical protein
MCELATATTDCLDVSDGLSNPISKFYYDFVTVYRLIRTCIYQLSHTM